jgi:hypothetical protein
MSVYVIVSKSFEASSHPMSACPPLGLLLGPNWYTKLPSSFRMSWRLKKLAVVAQSGTATHVTTNWRLGAIPSGVPVKYIAQPGNGHVVGCPPPPEPVGLASWSAP